MSLVTLFKAACQFGTKQYRITLTSYNTFSRATPGSLQGGSTAVGQVVWSSPFTLYRFMGERTLACLFLLIHHHHHHHHHSA